MSSHLRPSERRPSELSSSALRAPDNSSFGSIPKERIIAFAVLLLKAITGHTGGIRNRVNQTFSSPNERIYRTVYATKSQARRDIIRYIEGFYNS